MADFASIIDISPSTSINAGTFGYSCRDRKRIARKMKKLRKQLKKRAKRTPGPAGALGDRIHVRCPKHC